MEKFQLSVLFKIIGIGSASGLLYQNDLLYIISDNSTYLYEYNMADQHLNKIALVENPQENIPKKDKPDFEAITLNSYNYVTIFGSGSTKDRNKSYVYKPMTGEIRQADMEAIYSECKDNSGIGADEFNIEGLIINGNEYYLFQRGNGKLGKNGICCVEVNPDSMNFKFVPFGLPKIKNVPATFTDAILVDDKIWFLASAEDTASTYDDGEVLGSLIGTIDLKTMKLEKTIQISDKHKFEGLTLYKKSAAQIEFLLCEDTDSDVLESNIYKLVIRD